jgi:hypothetical protein
MSDVMSTPSWHMQESLAVSTRETGVVAPDKFARKGAARRKDAGVHFEESSSGWPIRTATVAALSAVALASVPFAPTGLSGSPRIGGEKGIVTGTATASAIPVPGRSARVSRPRDSMTPTPLLSAHGGASSLGAEGSKEQALPLRSRDGKESMKSEEARMPAMAFLSGLRDRYVF